MRATTAPAEGAESSELLAELAGDLDRGFTALYHSHRQVVFSTALRVSGRWADAEDLTAEAFLRAYRALRGYRRDRIMALEPRPWLVTILLNTWRNSQRTRSRRPAEAPLESAADSPERTDGPQALTEGRETRQELAGLLLELPEQQRVAVVLRHVSGLTLAEIGEVLGTGEGTVKSHISRGLSKLRTLEAPGIGAASETRAAAGGAGR